MSSDELVRLGGHLSVAIGDPAGGVGDPAHRDALVVDPDPRVMVGGLGARGEPVDELDAAWEGVERELALERDVEARPRPRECSGAQYSRSRKNTPTRSFVEGSTARFA